MKAFAFILGACCAALADAPRGDDKVASIVRFEIPGSRSEVRAAVAADEGIYIAGESWHDEKKAGKEHGTDLWLWRVDSHGKAIWQKKLPSERTPGEFDILGLIARDGGGVRIIEIRIGTVTIFDYKKDGEVESRKVLGRLNGARSIVPLSDGKMLILGADYEKDVAWISAFDREGKSLWRNLYDPGKSDYLHSGVQTQDGSIVLVGQTGEFNKFGQGPSKLVLLRIDESGKRLAEGFVDGGRTFPKGSEMMATAGNDVLVPWTSDQLPPIANAPAGVPNFQARIARFDPQMKQLWDKPAPETSMPGGTTLSGPAPFISLAASFKELKIRCIDENANQLWQSIVKADGMVHPVAALRMGAQVAVICSYTEFAATDESYAMIVFLKPPKAEAK